jgi:mono/diheme cytochrome c family protein
MSNTKRNHGEHGDQPFSPCSPWFLLLALAACLLAGCRQDMHNLPRYEPYEPNGMRPPVEGTVARGSLPVAGQPASAPAGPQDFPLVINAEVLARGQERFNISCSPCHSKLGDGNGMIVQRGLRRPPSFHEERLRQVPNSYFYDVITNGFGAMYSYADQLSPEDRWKVIAYIRALQLSQHASLSDVPPSERAKLEAEGTAKPATGGQAPGSHGSGGN